MNVNLQMFAVYNLKIQTGHITENYLHAGAALSPELPTYRYLQSVVKPEPQLLCMRPSASLYLFLFNGNAYRLPLIPSGPVLSRCSSFDIYGSYMYIGYIGRKQGFEYVYAMKKSCHQHLLRPLSNNLIDFCNFIYRQTFSFR